MKCCFFIKGSGCEAAGCKNIIFDTLICGLITLLLYKGPSVQVNHLNPGTLNPRTLLILIQVKGERSKVKSERQGKQKVRWLAKPLIIQASKPLNAGEYY
jgi:hypothetical protein